MKGREEGKGATGEGVEVVRDTRGRERGNGEREQRRDREIREE